MQTSTTPMLVAAGAAVVVGLIGAVVVLRVARRSPAWAVAAAPVFAVACIAAGVTAAAQQMLLEAEELTAVVSVLVVSALIALVFGLVVGRRVAAMQQQSALERAERAGEAQLEAQRRDMISWLSHDLRSPLARMRVLSEAAEDGLAPPDYTTRILAEVDGLNLIVDDIATLSRLGSPATPLHLAATDLCDLASDVVAASQPLADRLDIRLLGGTSGAVPVSADPAELTRALNNLIGNALRHTRAGGHVRVDVESDGPTARLTVSDQCGGIPAEQVEHLFEPGWRGTTARTPGDGGAGLGLTITRSVVEAHGGTVTVAAIPDGCAFVVQLPAAPKSATKNLPGLSAQR